MPSIGTRAATVLVLEEYSHVYGSSQEPVAAAASWQVSLRPQGYNTSAQRTMAAGSTLFSYTGAVMALPGLHPPF